MTIGDAVTRGMRHLLIPKICILSMLVSGDAGAQRTPASSRTSTTYDRCMIRATTNWEFAECGDAEIARLEAELMVVWKKAAAVYTATPDLDASLRTQYVQARQALLNGQRAWIKYKDTACLYLMYVDGREGQVVHARSCTIDILLRRIEDLRAISDNRS